jgi:hypothetical protein
MLACAVGAAGVWLYYSVESGSYADAAISGAFGMLLCAAVVVGLRLHRPRERKGWWLLLAGHVCWTAGDVVYAWYLHTVGEPPYPGWSDAFYLAGYPLLAAAIHRFIRAEGGSRTNLLDALIATAVCALVGWALLVEPYLSDPTLTSWTRAVAVSYPVMDGLLIALLARLATTTRRLNPALLGLALALALPLFGDLGYSLLTVHGTWREGAWWDATWLLGYVSVGVAALHPSMTALGRPVARTVDPPHSLRFATLLALSFLIIPVLDITTPERARFRWYLLAGAVVLLVLCGLRLKGLVDHLRTVVTDRDRTAGLLAATLESTAEHPRRGRRRRGGRPQPEVPGAVANTRRVDHRW